MPAGRRLATLEGMTADTAPRVPTRGRYVGPPPIFPAVATVVTFVLSLVVGATAGAFSTPGDTAADVLARAQDHPTAIAWAALFQVGSAVALGVFTAAITTVLQARGMRVAGVAIARFGGTAAAVLLAIS